MTQTIPAMFESTLARLPDKPAIHHGDASLTFAELYRDARATAQVLHQLGVKKGDRVGVCMSKTLDQVVAIVGALYAETIFVPILPKLRRDNIAHIVNNSGMTAVIVDATRIDEVRDCAAGLKLIVARTAADDDELPSLCDLRQHASPPMGEFSGAPTDTAAIIYSSGSTGRPKGIMISHRNLSDGARIVADYLGTREDDRITGVLSFNFDYGLNQLWQVLYRGASLYLHEFIFPNDLFTLIAQHQLTVLPVMPVIISRMFDSRFYAPDTGATYPHLRTVCTTGGPVSAQMIDNVRTTFHDADVYLMYGLTEAFRSSYLPPDELLRRPTSIGKAIPEVELYVVDEHGADCPPGVPGELMHRGGCIAQGYWRDERKTAERFREIDRFPGERVVFSGDTVKADEDGFLYFLGRRDSMIKTHGYRVSPTEVEEAANKFQNIQASAAFGIRNVEVTEDIALAYTSTDGKPIHRRVLRQFLRTQLPTYMVPRYLAHFDDFPATGNAGKIDRTAVLEELHRRVTADEQTA